MSLLGVRLTVLAGPTIPLPLPGPIASRLRSVQVTENDREASVFTVTFDAGRSGPAAALDTPLLAGSPLSAGARLVLLLLLGAVPTVLMDGIVTSLELTPGDSPGSATLTVTGEDVSVLLDRVERDAEHPALNDYLQVLKLLAPYAADGIVPMAIPPPSLVPPLPIEQIPTQNDTDLQYLKTLAGHYGYASYVIPGPVPGTSTFYWGPPVRAGLPQPAVSVDLGPVTNVRTAPRFRQDLMAPVAVEGSVQDPTTGSAVPVTAQASLMPPLAALPLWLTHGGSVRKRRLRTSGLSAPEAFTRAQGEVESGVDAVVGEGELDGSRYGAVLRPRGLVGVRGAGWSHDGLWYVRSVSHDLGPGAYSQKFTIAREGYGSTVPLVLT